jgi:type IV secretory pathway component VirB8
MFEKYFKSSSKFDELGNMPTVMNPRERRTFSDLVSESRVQAARWFLIAVIEGVVIMALCVGIDLMTPLVKTVPYMVKIDADSGQVLAKPVAAEPFVVEPRFVAAEARSFVRNLMSIDPFLTRRDLERASTRVVGKASAEFKEFLLTERPFERMAKTPGLIRTTEINSADASQKNIVFVFAQTSERISVGAPIVTKWRFTIHYLLDTTLDQKGFEENPLGFVITHFERLQDNLQ